MAEVDLEIRIANLEDAIGKLQSTSAKATKVAEDIGKAFQLEQASAGLARVAGHLDGLAKNAVDAASQIVQGFASGGLVGGAVAGLGVAVEGVADAWRASARAAAEAEKQAKAAADAQRKEADTLEARIQKANDQIRAVFEAGRSGGSIDAEARKIAIERAKADLDEKEQHVRNTEAAMKFDESLIGSSWRARNQIMTDGARAEIQQREANAAASLKANQARLEQEKNDAANAEQALTALRAEARAAADAEALEKARTATTKVTTTRGAIVKKADDDEYARHFAMLEAKAEAALRWEQYRSDSTKRIADKEANDRKKSAEKEKQDRERDAKEANRIAIFSAQEQKRVADDLAAHAQKLQDEADRKKKESADKEKQEREQLEVSIIAAGASLASQAADFILTEQTKTKAQYEEAAKRAAVQAAIETAEGFALLATGNPGAAAAFISAGQYALIAGGNAIASASASGGASAGGSSSGSDSRASGGRTLASDRPSSSGAKQNVTLIFDSRGTLATESSIARTQQELQRRYARRQ